VSTPIADARLIECCASRRWAESMSAGWPYETDGELLAASERAFDELTAEDWREAFSGHARIGEPRDGIGAGEQAGVASAEASVIEALRAGNAAYEARFGHIFLIKASGLTAAEMLAALQERLDNDAEDEWRHATEQQREITRLRLVARFG
jgi:OHCU decarboxylase